MGVERINEIERLLAEADPGWAKVHQGLGLPVPEQPLAKALRLMAAEQRDVLSRLPVVGKL